MKIDGKKIASLILRQAKINIKKSGCKPKIVVFAFSPTNQDLSFIKTKQKFAHQVGAKFQLILYSKIPRYEQFANELKQLSLDPSVSAIVIQRPLPSQINSISMFNYIPDNKEIESFKTRTPYLPPIGMAVLTAIKYPYIKPKGVKPLDIIFNYSKDCQLYRNIFKKKTVVIIGRGETGGKPIADIFRQYKINFLSLHSKTPSPETFLIKADFIISAVGKKVIKPEYLKSGVFLIGVGIRKENNQWHGDYDENEIKKIASFYTPTPGGIGPIDVAYLMYNLSLSVEKKEQ